MKLGPLGLEMATAPRRVVALGASNLTRGFPILVSAARASAGPDVEVFAALGLGRSYGMESRVLARTLPGILDSGLWAALAGLPPLPTRAVVTDVGNDEDATLGLDFRMGLGTATTLSAAVNPDFGQVEQDPAVLNLSVFETFLQEKRPFFTEDSRTLVPTVTPQATMFHSRRIGQRPGRLAIADGETVIERPDATTILGATPNSCTKVPSPSPSACTPSRLSSGAFALPGIPNHQRASYSRNPVGLTSGRRSKSAVLDFKSARGFGSITRIPIGEVQSI